MPTIRSRVSVFVQVWFFVLTRTAVAGVVFGAVCCTVAAIVVGANSVSSFAVLIRLVMGSIVSGIVVGALFGGITGGIAGFSGGIVIGLLTAIFFYPPRRSLIFLLVVHVASLITCVSAVNFVVKSILFFWESSTYPVILDVIPAVFAALGSYWVSQKMIRWYTTTYFVRA